MMGDGGTWVVVPESVENPLKYYRNNTAASRSLIESAVACGVKHFIFSSTAATYGIPEVVPVREDSPKQPINPYGMSKLMTEYMLRDVAAAHPMNFCALRYFNVAGADPQGRIGQSTAGATHLIKVAVEAALGKRCYRRCWLPGPAQAGSGGRWRHKGCCPGSQPGQGEAGPGTADDTACSPPGGQGQRGRQIQCR